MPEFDDVVQPPHYRLQLDYNPMASIERYTVLLKDGETTATIYPVQNTERLPPGLLAFLCDEFNIEIERGDTFSFFDTLHLDSFQNYWFGAFAGVMVLGDLPTLEGPKHWEKECLGTFFIKPNYPGRASHICTAGFLVNAGIRGKGIGRTLTDCFLQWAPRLGYTYCVFNLVFETNVPARSLWELLNFKRIGRIKSAGILKGHDTAVDALIYGRELVELSDATLGAYRFDKIKFYLETGKYPAMADRQEKSRLRSSAAHYRLEYGKLMLRDKEVVSDPVRQLQICAETHLLNHGGINKTTSAVSEKYHWTRIKDTVLAAIKNCVACTEQAKQEALVKRAPIMKQKLPGNPRDSVSSPAGAVAGGTGISGSSGTTGTTSSSTSNTTHSTNSTNDTSSMGVPLHHMPSRDSDTLLGHDLAGLDDGLIAVVEAAHKRQKTGDGRGVVRNHTGASAQPTYAAVAAAAVSAGHNNHTYYAGEYPHHPFTNKYGTSKRHDPREDSVPVDPDVSAFDHSVNAGGDEIEIARALMQSNEVDHHDHHHHHHHHETPPTLLLRQDRHPDHDRNDDANMFFKND